MKNQSLEKNDPIYYQDATALANLIKLKQLSPVEVVQAHLDRIEQVNPGINAITTLMAEAALIQAKAAEMVVMKGLPAGRFHGVPFTIKDAIDHAGVPTQAGSRLLAHNIPAKDATVVARFKAAGAIPIAKTNVPEFSGYTETDNLVTGRTNNPWNPERIAGGSSGGESAAISSGMSPIGLGSDLAISVRGPAALTGIVGLKATHGRIPYTGHFPRYMSQYWHMGPMARTVRDISAAYEVMSGPDGIDPYSVFEKNTRPAFSSFTGRPLRVGYLATHGFGPVDPEVAAAVEAAAKLLADSGMEVTEIDLPFFEERNWMERGLILMSSHLNMQLRPMVAGKTDELHAIGQLLATLPEVSITEFLQANMDVEQLRAVFVDFFGKYDVLLCPVIPFTAPRHGLMEYLVNGVKIPASDIQRATVPFNLTGLPALSVPFTFSTEQLPINVQLVSKWFDEETILYAGQLIESWNHVAGRHPLP